MKEPSDHLRTIQRRVDFLKSRTHKNSFDLAELGALELALVNLQAQRKPLTDEKWQPIETAPHYETILIWQPKYQRLALSINDGFQYKHATHWMPLPAPPTEAAHGIKEKTND